MLTKRIIIATIMGVICGIICWKMAASSSTPDAPLYWYIAASIFFSRVLLGFGIGISNWKMAWWLHGIVLGVIFSIPEAFAAYEKGFVYFIATIAMGVVYGVLIELVTTVLFKAKQA